MDVRLELETVEVLRECLEGLLVPAAIILVSMGRLFAMLKDNGCASYKAADRVRS